MADALVLSESDLAAKVDAMLDAAQGLAAEIGLSQAQIDNLWDLLETFQTDMAANVTAQSAAHAARQRKDGSKKSLLEEVRAFQRVLVANPAVDDAHLAAMGMKRRDRKPSRTPPPGIAVLGRVEAGQVLAHVLRFVPAEGGRRGRPEGVVGCEVWMKIGGEAPTGPGELRYHGLATRPGYRVEFEGEDAGKPVHYMLRWVNRRGEPGPWSETVTAWVGG
jgi:hypothetical protein